MKYFIRKLNSWTYVLPEGKPPLSLRVEELSPKERVDISWQYQDFSGICQIPIEQSVILPPLELQVKPLTRVVAYDIRTKWAGLRFYKGRDTMAFIEEYLSKRFPEILRDLRDGVIKIVTEDLLNKLSNGRFTRGITT